MPIGCPQKLVCDCLMYYLLTVMLQPWSNPSTLTEPTGHLQTVQGSEGLKKKWNIDMTHLCLTYFPLTYPYALAKATYTPRFDGFLNTNFAHLAASFFFDSSYIWYLKDFVGGRHPYIKMCIYTLLHKYLIESGPLNPRCRGCCKRSLSVYQNLMPAACP